MIPPALIRDLVTGASRLESVARRQRQLAALLTKIAEHDKMAVTDRGCAICGEHETETEKGAEPYQLRLGG